MKCKRIQIWLLFCTVFLISGMALPHTAESLTSYIDEHNRFILDGDPFFPLGLYVGQCSIDDQSVQLDEIENSPFDTLMNYTVNTCGATPATPAEIISYLDQLDSGLPDSRNLKLIYALNEYIPFDLENELDPCGDIDIASIEAKVGNPDITDHDAVISWYLNDEVGSYNAAAQADCLAQLVLGYDKIKELDTNHAVWSVHWSTDWLLPEAHTTDVLGMDSYPIDNKANPMDEVIRVADAAAQVGAQTDKPFWLVPQIFTWKDYPGDFRWATGRFPTKAEMRAMSYLAVNHGAKGLIYYSYFDIRNDANYDTRWIEIKDIASEIDQLRSVFLSTSQTSDNDVTCNNGDIDFKLMWYDGTYYLLAVNTKEETISGVSFQINLANKPAVFDTLFEGGRQVSVVSGTVTDSFGPYEVHVYQWQGSFEEDGDGDGGSGGGGGGGCFISAAAFGSYVDPPF